MRVSDGGVISTLLPVVLPASRKVVRSPTGGASGTNTQLTSTQETHAAYEAATTSNTCLTNIIVLKFHSNQKKKQEKSYLVIHCLQRCVNMKQKMPLFSEKH